MILLLIYFKLIQILKKVEIKGSTKGIKEFPIAQKN